jgi:ATP-dependent helicase/DNAse subunit B
VYRCPSAGAVASVFAGGFGPDIDKIRRALAADNRSMKVDGCADRLYGSYTPSATRIESFYGCPYRHFIRYGVRAERQREYSIDKLDVGRFAHDVLDMVAKSVAERGWDNVGEAELRMAVRACSARAAENEPRYRLNAHNEAVLSALTGEIELAAEMIRRQSQNGALKPFKTEYEFKLDDPGVTGKWTV